MGNFYIIFAVYTGDVEIISQNIFYTSCIGFKELNDAKMYAYFIQDMVSYFKCEVKLIPDEDIKDFDIFNSYDEYLIKYPPANIPKHISFLKENKDAYISVLKLEILKLLKMLGCDFRSR